MAASLINRIVVVGAGFAGIYTWTHLHRYYHNNPAVQLILINPKNYFLFTPLLHEVATGGINPENIVEPLRKILGCCMHEFFLGKVQKVRLKEKILETSGGEISYDYLVLAPGGETQYYNIPGAAEYSFPLKSLEDAVRLKNHCIRSIECASHARNSNDVNTKLHFVIIGGGPTGVELAAEMSQFLIHSFGKYYPEKLIKNIRISLLHRGKELLPQFSPPLRQKALQSLLAKGIHVRLAVAVQEVNQDFIILENGERLRTSTVIWVGGVRPVPLAFDESLLTSSGRIQVLSTLQLSGYPSVFILGDIAAVSDPSEKNMLPMFAQVATQEARYAALNIQRLIQGKNTMPFTYKHQGTLVSLGQWMAVGEIHTYVFSGRFAWWLWRTIYLSKMISWRKKIKVAIDWTINLFSPRDISEL